RFEGARWIDEGFINAARLLGASEWQITRTVVVPSTMAWVFASLTPAISFSLIGVIVGEFIGAEHGIGRMIIESEARGEAAGMMVSVFVLMIVGVILASLVRRLQAYLLRWRPSQTATTYAGGAPLQWRESYSLRMTRDWSRAPPALRLRHRVVAGEVARAVVPWRALAHIDRHGGLEPRGIVERAGIEVDHARHHLG